MDLALGIDIGGTNTVYGLVDRRGTIIEQGRMPTTGKATVAAFIDALKTKVLPLLDKTGRSRIIGCGVGAPNGNFYTGEIAYAANLPWDGVIPMATMISQALGLQTKLTNDANAATIGEMTYGAAKGMKDFMMVTLGTGVGSGFVSNGQLIYGHDGFAGELGHVTVKRNGRECGCGRRGCLETYASARGMVRTAREWLALRTMPTTLRKYEQRISAKAISQAAAEGDLMARELFEFTGEILGQCLANTVAITAPEAIILFGGVAKAGDLIIEPTKRHMEENILRNYKNKVAIIPSALPSADAAILGASALVW
jgi:glucokinase